VAVDRDIDVDYVPPVRSHLKEKWAPEFYGQEYVCNIGSYNTYGLKSALIDMTRVFGGDRAEILAITTRLGLKDEEGDPLSFDKALELYPALKAWAEANPEIASAAKRLLHADLDWEKYGYKGEPPHRNRSMGMHAGGLIISSKPIKELVPMVRGKDGAPASAWVEGLHGQDLTLVGLVKYDLLVIDALTRVSLAIKFIRERHGLDKIMAMPGGPNFSDLTYLDDPKCMEVASTGDLKMVFQFDSEGIRALAREGGVSSFEDMVAYTALYRPGPMDCLGKDTLVETSVGSKRISELSSDTDSIAYLDTAGEKRFTNKFVVAGTGVKKVVKIRLKNGKEIIASKNHRFLAASGEYVKAENLRAGEKIACG
jgi:DNA polymerase-3 subunit alpha